MTETRKPSPVPLGLLNGLDDFDLVITPKGATHGNLRDLWRYRELLLLLCWRDIKIRYRQTIMGVGWAVAQPLLSMIVFACILGRLAPQPSTGVPYPLCCYAALLPWTYFANAVSRSSTSLVSNSSLVTKIYFPRAIITVASALPGLVDFSAALVAFVPLFLFFHFVPALASLWLVPAIMAACFVLVLGLSFWLSAIGVRIRDVGFLIPFVIQIWMFATPVIYSGKLVPERYRILAYFNPMFGIVDGFRAAVLGLPFPTLPVAMSVAIAMVLFFTGFYFFRATEKGVADVI